jgi:hypothetical protein
MPKKNIVVSKEDFEVLKNQLNVETLDAFKDWLYNIGITEENIYYPNAGKDQVSEMITLVTDKLFKSSQKYGTSSYVLNDMTREIQEEIVDLVGWSLMESIRLMEALQGKIYHADQIYWENFLQKQNTEFLKVLLDKVMEELEKRRSKDPFVGYTVDLTYFKESGKYYSESSYVTSQKTMYYVIQEVKFKMKERKLPGLVDGAYGYTVCLNVPDHPENVPQLLLWSKHGN